MRTNFTLTVLSIFIFSLTFFVGCETEPYGDNNGLDEQLSLQEEFQLHFTLENFEDPVGHITKNIEVNWNVYQTKSFEGKEWFEFEVKQNKPVAYSRKGEIQGQSFTVLAHKNENGIKFFINKMLSFSSGKGFTYFNISAKSYHGMAYLYNLEGEVEHLFHFEKGYLMNSVENIKVSTEQVNTLGLIARGDCYQKASTARCETALGCALAGGSNVDTGGGCGGGGGTPGSGGSSGFVQVFTHHYTEWYNDHGNGEYSWFNTTFDGTTDEWVWTSGDGTSYSDTSWTYAETQGGPNPDGYRSGNTTYSDEPPAGLEDEEPNRLILNLNDMKDYPCVAEIIKALANGDFKNLRINNLGDIEGGEHLSKTILDLFSTSANYHLSISVGDLENANGSTLPKANSPNRGEVTFYITLDEDFINNATSLIVARTLIHESLHAYLSYQYQNMPNASFSTLLRNYLSQNGGNPNDAQHQLMVEYADAIGYSLGVWDGNSLPLQYYKDLGWSGDMLSTNEFSELSNSRRTSIRNANIAEGSALQKATNNAKGVQCN